MTTVASSATENVDYTPSSEEVRFAPGNTAAKIVKIPIINDTLTENKEEFSANLSTTDTDVNLLNKTATIVVEDDDSKLTGRIWVHCSNLYFTLL